MARRKDAPNSDLIARNEHNEVRPREAGGTKFHGRERSVRNRDNDEDDPFDLFSPRYNDG
jgi:hypothetical protein